MLTSRLERSTNAPLRDVSSIKDYCSGHNIPFSEDFIQRIVPTPDLKKNFKATYNLTPFPKINLKKKGTSSVLVFETKDRLPKHNNVWSNHGEVSAAILEIKRERLCLSKPCLLVLMHRI